MLSKSLIALTAFLAIANSTPMGDSGEPLLEREAAKTLCHLGQYRDVVGGYVGDGIDYERGKKPHQLLEVPGNVKPCPRISCSYGTAFSLCNNANQKRTIYTNEVADVIQQSAEKCGVHLNDYASSKQAFQYFRGDGLNILIHGADC